MKEGLQNCAKSLRRMIEKDLTQFDKLKVFENFDGESSDQELKEGDDDGIVG